MLRGFDGNLSRLRPSARDPPSATVVAVAPPPSSVPTIKLDATTLWQRARETKKKGATINGWQTIRIYLRSRAASMGNKLKRRKWTENIKNDAESWITECLIWPSPFHIGQINQKLVPMQTVESAWKHIVFALLGSLLIRPSNTFRWYFDADDGDAAGAAAATIWGGGTGCHRYCCSMSLNDATVHKQHIVDVCVVLYDNDGTAMRCATIMQFSLQEHSTAHSGGWYTLELMENVC